MIKVNTRRFILSKILIFFLFFISLFSWAGNSKYRAYIIKEYDIVSDLLHKNDLHPIYGDSNWLEKVLKLNRLTLESAKKLKVGDVIVLPVESFLFEPQEYQDHISEIRSSTESRIYKRIESDFTAVKKHNLSLLTTFFLQDQNFSEDKVSLKQNLKITGLYHFISSIEGRTSLNPYVKASLITQAQAEFNSNPNRSADFTPSWQMSGGLEFSHRETNLAIYMEFMQEEYSRIFNVAGEYFVRNTQNTWGEFGMTKYFEFKNKELFVKTSFAKAVGNQAQRAGAQLGLEIYNHYLVSFNGSNTSISLGEDISINEFGLTVGYRW